MSRLVRVLKSAFKELVKPESFRKGDDFEDYVREWIFPQEDYDIIHKTHDYSTNSGDYIEDTLEPDFLLRDRSNKKEFYVEAKFRSDYWKGAIEWSYPKQLIRYKAIDKKRPLFIALGVGGEPDSPDEIFVFPVRTTKYPKLFESVLEKFEVEPDEAMLSKYLWKLLKK